MLTNEVHSHVFDHDSPELVTTMKINDRILFIKHQDEEDDSGQDLPKTCELKLRANISWKIERVLWIGFYKNVANEQCFISKLPKVLILCILRYLQWNLIDQIN